MTVKSLSDLDKAYIVNAFTTKTKTINELAVLYERHRTTIIRVLEEAGVEPSIRRRKVKEELNISGTNTARVEMFEPRKQPWYSRVAQYVSSKLFNQNSVRTPRY